MMSEALHEEIRRGDDRERHGKQSERNFFINPGRIHDRGKKSKLF